jgi:cytoskeleton protein RodZ
MAPEIGQELKRARESRGLELSDAEQATKIRSKYLRAIEEDRWADLPGVAYGRGFLSTYARYLGLDERALVERYKAGPGRVEATAPIPEDMLPRRGEVRKHPVRVGAIAKAIGVVALVAIVVVVLIVASDDGESQRGAGDVLRGDGNAAGATDATEADEEEAEPEPEEEAEEAEPQGRERRAPTRLKLVATDSVWVCLVDNRDRPRLEGETLAAGDERGPFRGTAFEATFGNGAVEMVVNGDDVEVGEAAEPLGFRIDRDGVSELDEGERPDCA